MAGMQDRIGDLSWLGNPEYADLGWFQVEEPAVPELTKDQKAAAIMSQIEHYLAESESNVAVDNVNMTKEQRASWIEYRRLIRDIPLQSEFPEQINWPSTPL